MLKLDGNSEYAFATENSINANPLVYIEWNYNSISRPYVVASNSYGVLDYSEILKNSSAWTCSNGYANIAKYAGYPTRSNPNPEAIGLNATSGNNATFKSPRVSLTKSTTPKYYKMTFYAKANQEIVSVAPAGISNNEIDIETSAKGEVSYSYRILQVDKSGNMAGIDYDGNDIASINSNPYAANIKLHWDHSKYPGPVYHIYRTSVVGDPAYLQTTRIMSYRIDSFNNATTENVNTAIIELEGNASDNIVVGSRIKVKTTKNFKNLSKPIATTDPNVLLPYQQSIEGTEWAVTSVTATTNKTTITVTYRNGSENLLRCKMSSSGRIQPVAIPQTFIDNNINSIQTKFDPIPLVNDMIRLMAIPILKNNGDVLESAKYFIRLYETETSHPTTNHGTVNLDSIGYKKIEVFFGSKEPFDSVEFDFDINAGYYAPSIYIYNPEIYEIEDWDFTNCEYYPIESVFDPYRPGEALTHPFIRNADKKINASIIGSKLTKDKPVSFAVFNPDNLCSNLAPYKQVYDSYLNNTMRYYVGNWRVLDPAQNRLSTSIMANYHDDMSINKIVIKGSNCFSDLTKASGSVTLLIEDETEVIEFNEGDFDKSGLMTLFFNGIKWSTSRPTDGTFPPTLTDSGILQNVREKVSGLIFTINKINFPAVRGGTNTLRAHIIEISPRLELDISGITRSFSVNKTVDDFSSAAGFPLSYINSNTGNISISNIPVYKNSFPYTIFDNFAEGSTFYGLLKQNVKLTVALRSPIQDFTDVIPIMTMYADEWSISDISELSISLYDAAKSNLMSLYAPDYFCENQGMFATITNIMDAAGFSDYDYDGLKTMMKRRASGTTHFWCDRKQTLFETLQSFFVAHQIGAFFDEYGIMRFVDIDQIIDNYLDREIEPDFAVTDVPVDIKSGNQYIRYIPNIISQSYQTNVSKRIGRVVLEYSVPVRHLSPSGDVNIDGLARTAESSAQVWAAKGNTGLISSFANKSLLSSDNVIYTDKILSSLTKQGMSPANTMGESVGSAFFQGELVSWSGFEYQFYPYTRAASVTFSSSAMSVSASPFQPSASIVTTSPSAAKVSVKMAAYGEYIPLNAYVQSISSKKGPKKAFTASWTDTSANIIISKTPAASTVAADMFIVGPYFSPNTYITSVEVTSPSTIITLNKKPTKTGVLSGEAYGSSTVFILSANTTASSKASSKLSLPFDVSFSSDDSAKIATPEYSKGLKAVIVNPTNEINNMLNQIMNQDSRITGAKYDFTGNVYGLTRGERFTSVRNHYMLDDDARLPYGWFPSSVCFDKKYINSYTTVNFTTSAPDGSTIVFDKNVAKMKVNRDNKGGNYPVMISPKQATNLGDYNQPTSASCFNYFSFLFNAQNFNARKHWGSDTEIIEFGLYIATTQGNIMIALANDKNSTYLKTNVDRGSTGAGDKENDLSHYVLKTTHAEGATAAGSILWKKKVKNVFDGHAHRFGVLFHDSSDLASTADRQYVYCTVMIDNIAYGPYLINKYNTSTNHAIPSSTWGFYVRNTDRNFNGSGKVKTVSINLHEMYACKWWNRTAYEVTKQKIKWHWQSPHFLNGIMNKNVDIEPKYYFWGRPVITGIKFYDSAEFETSPIQVNSLKEDFAGYDPQTTVDQTFKTLTKTNKSHLLHSEINKTPFRFNFAITHKKNEIVWLSTSDNKIGDHDFTAFALQANYNKLTDPITIEKVIDASSLANSIQLSTQWVQSDHDAQIMLNKIGLLANSFNNEVSVSIFGNPLIQTGDICKFIYSLKRIGFDPDMDVEEKMFFVKSVSHNYANGLRTQLILKPLFDVPQ